MIKKLTKKQKNQLSIVVDKWIKIQLSTQQYTNEEITDSVNKFYKSINKSKPKIIILDSPIQCAQYINDNNISINHSIYNSINNSITDSIWNSILDSIYYSIWYAINNSICNSISYSIWDSIWYSIWYSIRYSICLDYSVNILNIKELEQYRPFLNLSEKVYFAVLEDDVVIICRKLKSIHLDDNNQLHADGIKAFQFNGVYGSYFNHGTPIPEQYGSVKIKDWKAKWLLNEQNTEYKRMLIREIGYDKIAKQLNSTIIHKDKNMELLEIPNIDIEPMRLLKVQCPSTQSIYLLRVPPNIDRCEASRQWTLFNEHDEYEFIKES